LFILFAVSNALLSYFSLPPVLTLWIGILGLLVPFLLACRDLARNRAETPGPPPPFQDEFIPSAWMKGSLLLLALGVFLRFWRLTTLSDWPLNDESWFGYIALRLLEGETPRWFYSHNAVQPFTNFGLAAFFKCFGVSLRTLWLYQAALSLLALCFYGWAARRWVSKSLAFVFWAVLALSFWPLYLGRFGTQGGMVFLWEGICLALLAPLLDKNREVPGLLRPALLGLAAGLGFYTYAPLWLFIATALGAALALPCLGKGRGAQGAGRALLIFLAAAFAVSFPLAWAMASSMDPAFLRALWVFGGQPDPRFLPDLLSKLSVYFWGPAPSPFFSYNPLWGGFLNPVLGALALLGLLEAARYRSRVEIKFLAACGLWLWLPQALSRGQEYIRAVPLIPVFLALVALGFRRWMVHPRARAVPAGFLALALLALSVGLDAHHLFGAYHRWAVAVSDTGFTNKSLERKRAYALFEQVQQDWGPGLILANLVDDINDQSLSLASWRFNAVENPGAPAPRVPWVGILCNVHYRDYLARRFPRARWAWLASDVFRENGGLMAGVIPVDAANGPALQRWVLAEKAMRVFASDVINTQLSPGAQGLASRMEIDYPLFRGDPFLESCYWEKQAQNAFLCRRFGDMIQPLRNAIRLGVPQAHLYNRLGVVCLATGDFQQAGWALEHAMKFKDNRTTAAYLYAHYWEPRRLLNIP
jgi:hypothetical protein